VRRAPDGHVGPSRRLRDRIGTETVTLAVLLVPSGARSAMTAASNASRLGLFLGAKHARES